MKKLLLGACAGLMLAGCGTVEPTKIDQVKEIFSEAVVLTAPVADIYLKDQVAKGKLTQEQADLIKATHQDLNNNWLTWMLMWMLLILPTVAVVYALWAMIKLLSAN